MRFFGRQKEISVLRGAQLAARGEGSRMTVVAGRRRIGKTRLVLEACRGEALVYWLISPGAEGQLIRDCAQAAHQALGLTFERMPASFTDLFAVVLKEGEHRTFTLVIDGFEELIRINPAVAGDLEKLWKRQKRVTHVNLVLCITDDAVSRRRLKAADPLFLSCADGRCELNPFTPAELEALLAEANPGFENDDLLALFALTGGAAKYVEYLLDAGATDRRRMIECVAGADSLFLEEGRRLLLPVLGRHYGLYFSILGAIAAGKRTLSEIGVSVGDKSVAGQLKRLEETYGLIEKRRPLFAGPASQTVRFEINDVFLRFWFAFIWPAQAEIETGNHAAVAARINAAWPDWSQEVLAEWFRRKLNRTTGISEVSDWWSTGSRSEELALIAVKGDGNIVLAADVSRTKDGCEAELEAELSRKIEVLREAAGKNVFVQKSALLTLEDMRRCII